MSSGGFPAQMQSITSLFDMTTLVIEQVEPRDGGILLPKHAQVVPLRAPTGNDFRRKISVLSRLPYYLRVIGREINKADVVHVPQPGDMSFLGMMIALTLRKRILARYCGSWMTNSESTAMNEVTRVLMRVFAGGRNVMLATGTGAAAPATGMHWVFATAISREEISRVRADLDRPISRPLRLVFLGRLSPEKGIAFLIKAIGKLRAESYLDEKQLQLTIIGDGPQKAELQTLVENEGCASMVSFKGHLNRDELIRHLLVSDVCVLPSLSEGYPKARLDAMLCGVPIITSEAGFGREIIGSDGTRGWVVPCGDISALASTIEYVLNAPIDWSGIRHRCREYVEEHTLEAWAQLIGQICSRQWSVPFKEGKLCPQGR